MPEGSLDSHKLFVVGVVIELGRRKLLAIESNRLPMFLGFILLAIKRFRRL